MYAVGLMSGTSLDGVDVALVDIQGCGIDTKLELIKFSTYDISDEIKKEIKDACLIEKSSSALICSLNFKLGYLFADAVKKVCMEANLKLEELDFVASHGQTIYHIPKEVDGYLKSTLQIGEPAVIAYETKTKVISNFRTMDIAAGGEGAPLVPYSEYILYGTNGEDIALQNIGGIGNVTVIPGEKDMRKIYAFDTGPGNMMIDEACQILFNVKYDKGGSIAKTGNINKAMLGELMSHSYISKVPPKTTGREEFGEHYVKSLLEKYKNISKEDIVSTLTAFTGETIVDSYKKHILSKVNLKKVVIGGGGAHNKTLINYIKDNLEGVEVLTQEDMGYSSDAKEAIAFAILGNETLNKKSSNVPSATGATEAVILGNITII